jgi:hypothetical protein
MKVYKVIFMNNQPIQCREVDEGIVFEGSHHYVHTNGRLIYAIVKAESEIEVLKKVAEMISEVRGKYSSKTT